MPKGSEHLGTIVIIISVLVCIGSLVGILLITSFLGENSQNKTEWESFRLILIWILVGSAGITALLAYLRTKDIL